MKKLDQLLKKAVATRKRAHAPYSGYKIGAAVRMSDGKIFGGANVENASYGGTVCAERTAIWKAITEGAKGLVEEIVIVSDEKDPWPPCGMCRQVLAEFASPDTKVWLADTRKIVKGYTFGEIFPEAFSSKNMKK